MITNFKYADDTTLIAGTKEDLTVFTERVRKTSVKAGLNLIVLKTKFMTTGDTGEVTVDGNIVEVVTSFIFRGELITRYGLCHKEIRRGIKLATKVKLVKALVFPISLYGADTWGQDYKRVLSMSRCSTHNLCSEMT